MYTLNKILKQHSTVFAPHNKLKEIIINDKKSIIWIILIILEVYISVHLFMIDKILVAILLFFIYFLTLILGSYFHFKKIKNRFGNVEHPDEERMKKFIYLCRKNVKIDLEVKDEHKTIEKLIQSEIEKTNKNDQIRKSFYFTILSIISPIFFSLLVKNLDNVTFLTITITSIGLVLIFLSLNISFIEYKRISKLNHIKNILIEIEVMTFTNKRKSAIRHTNKNKKEMHIFLLNK